MVERTDIVKNNSLCFPFDSIIFDIISIVMMHMLVFLVGAQTL